MNNAASAVPAPHVGLPTIVIAVGKYMPNANGLFVGGVGEERYGRHRQTTMSWNSAPFLPAQITNSGAITCISQSAPDWHICARYDVRLSGKAPMEIERFGGETSVSG